MMLVHDDPFAITLLKPDGETKIERPAARAIAVNLTRQESYALTGANFDVTRRELDGAAQVLKKEIPGFVIGAEASFYLNKIEHQQIVCVICQDALTIIVGNRLRPFHHELFNCCNFRHPNLLERTTDDIALAVYPASDREPLTNRLVLLGAISPWYTRDIVRIEFMKASSSKSNVRKSELLDSVFASLSDPTRRAIVERLTREHEVSVGELAAPFRSSLPAVIKHIDVLEEAGLVVRRRRGRHVCCSLKARRMAKARAWLDHNLAFWTASLERLGDVVDGEKQ